MLMRCIVPLPYKQSQIRLQIQEHSGLPQPYNRFRVFWGEPSGLTLKRVTYITLIDRNNIGPYCNQVIRLENLDPNNI